MDFSTLFVCECDQSSAFLLLFSGFLISRSFRVGDEILYLSCLLIALATLDTLWWNTFVMVSLMVSMLSSSCSSFIGPICAASTLGGLLVIILSFPPQRLT